LKYKNYTQMTEGMVPARSMTWVPLKKYGQFGRDEKFSLLYRLLIFFKSTKRGLQNAESVALSKHVTHIDPRSSLPYYNLTTPIERTPIRHLVMHLAALVVWALGIFTSTQLFRM